MQLLLLALHGVAGEREVVLAADEASDSAGLTRVEDPKPAAVALTPYEPLRARRLQLAPRAEELAIRAEEDLRVVERAAALLAEAARDAARAKEAVGWALRRFWWASDRP